MEVGHIVSSCLPKPTNLENEPMTCDDVNGAYLKAHQLETLLALLTAGIATVLVQDAQLCDMVLPRTVENKRKQEKMRGKAAASHTQLPAECIWLQKIQILGEQINNIEGLKLLEVMQNILCTIFQFI